MTEMRVLAKGLRFPEGPVWLSDGSVALVEIARGTVTVIHPDGKARVLAETGGALGIDVTRLLAPSASEGRAS